MAYNKHFLEGGMKKTTKHLSELPFYRQRFEGVLNYEMEVAVTKIQGGSNMTGTDLCVNKPHCAAAVRP